MLNKARVFTSGRIQYVAIPAALRFRSPVVSSRRDPQTGDVILSEVPSLGEVLAALDAAQFPKDSLNEADRNQRPAEEHPALSWTDLFD